MIKSKPKMIEAFLLMSAILMMSIQTSMATEKDIMSNDVIKQAFDNNVNKISCIPETIETIEVYDSRLDEKEIIKPQSAKASYDYYKTYRTGVTCKGSGAASSYLLNANITFYVNVFFKSTKAVGHEKPVVTGVSGAYGATGYSKPSVTVSSWSANKMKFKGTCKLTAGGTYTMTGTKTISLP